MSMKPFERIGGRPAIERVVKNFYDRVFADPWLSLYFSEIPQAHIENQQIDFMSDRLGGPKTFSGRMPQLAHEHIHIDDELFDHRIQFLDQALREEGIDDEMRKFWLSIDESFRGVLVKELSECKKRFKSDSILDFPNPSPKKIAS